MAAVALVVVAAPLQAQQAANTTKFEAVGTPGEIDTTTQTDDVKFRSDRYERMTVPVHLSGEGPFRFLVDTGADRTAISRQVANRLGLQSRAGARLHSITGASSVDTARVPVLQLSSKTVHEIDAPLLEADNMGADGILGVDSLRSQRVLFDFKAQTLSIVPARSRAKEEDEGAIVVRGRLKNGRLVMTDAYADSERVSVVLDTGAQYSVGNSALRLALQRRRMISMSGDVELVSVTGEKVIGRLGLVEELEMGGMRMKGLYIAFTDAAVFGQLGLADRPALLLGMNALRSFDKVSIDFASKKLRVILPEHSEIEGARLAAR
jgi:predicted aspartyl protease